MKFLVLERPKSGVKASVLSKLSLLQHVYFRKLQKEGKIERYYHLIGLQGLVYMCDVSSEEELSRIVSQDPMFFHSRRRVYPLISAETHEKIVREAFPTK